jgi:hypothetical protein
MERTCEHGKCAPLCFRTGQATFIALGSGGDKLSATGVAPGSVIQHYSLRLSVRLIKNQAVAAKAKERLSPAVLPPVHAIGMR